jgi:hypothetical protein
MSEDDADSAAGHSFEDGHADAAADAVIDTSSSDGDDDSNDSGDDGDGYDDGRLRRYGEPRMDRLLGAAEQAFVQAIERCG